MKERYTAKKVNSVWMQSFKQHSFEFLFPPSSQFGLLTYYRYNVVFDAMLYITKIQSKNVQLLRQNYREKELEILDYPGLLKHITLNQIKICITQARQTKSVKLIKWVNLNISIALY